MRKLIAALLLAAQLFSVEAMAVGSDRVIEAKMVDGYGLAPNFILNGSAEFPISAFTSFNDGASSIPVDLTGGAVSQTTLSRTTTAGEVLNGLQSYKVVKAAANAQGEGVSAVFNVPPAYQGAMATINIPFRIISGTLVQGDLKVFVYDVTNSNLITPFNNDVVGAKGILTATFPVPAPASTPANIQMRVGFYFATTVTTAVTIAFDDVNINPVTPAYGPVVGPWTTYSLGVAPQGFGTLASQSARYRQVGETDEIEARFVAGTTAAAEAQLPLPPGCTSASDYTTLEVVDSAAQAGVLAGAFYTTIEPSKTYMTISIQSASLNALSKINGNTFLSTGGTATIRARVRCAGFAGSVPMTSATTFSISNYLANGTRVTGAAPTALGQYRSYLRNASARTWTETNGNPTTVPTAADGFVLYRGNVYTSADTNNNPTRYDIFVGKNLNVQPRCYQSTGKSGLIDCHGVANATDDWGFNFGYDPSTGVASFMRISEGGSNTHSTALDSTGTPITTAIYGDIIVSTPAIPVQVGTVRSEITLDTGNGFGSTNTKIRRFTNSSTVGKAATYNPLSDEATNGASILINEDGEYVAAYVDGHTTSSVILGISVNSSLNTTSIATVTRAQGKRIQCQTTGAAQLACTTPLSLKAGDIVRPHTDGVENLTTDAVSFTLTKVSN